MTTIFLFMWATGPFIGKAIELGIACVQCRTLISDFTRDIPTIEFFARKPYGNRVVWGDRLPNDNCDQSNADTEICNELL